MISTTSKSQLKQIDLSDRAAAANEAVRLEQLQELLGGKSNTGHTHSVGEIDGLAAALPTFEDSDSIAWSGYASARVRLAANGGLESGVDGLAVTFGTGVNQAARGNHTHAQLHNAVSLVSGVTIKLTLNGQQLGAEVRRGTGSGLTVNGGLVLDFGTGNAQAARGDHTHEQLHDAVTVDSTASIQLNLTGQAVRASARLAANGGLVSGVGGLAAKFGTGANDVARGNHTHSDATASAAGFLSVADKQKLDLYGALLDVDQSVPFLRHDVAMQGDYVGGRRRWGQAMQIQEMHLTANAPIGAPAIVGLEVDGSVVEEIEIPAGTGEVVNQKTLEDIHVAASKYVRLVLLSGVGTGIENEASRIECVLTVRPSIASLSPIRINAGGLEVSPFGDDAFYGAGAIAESVTDGIDISAVDDPAPEEVYQSARVKYNDPNPFSYLFTGLARGISYTVRLHFAELYWSAIGKQKMNMAVIGKTTATVSNFDTLSETSGVRFKAVIEEFTVEPDSDGEIEVKFTPLVNGDGQFHLSVNAIELVPIT